MRVMTRHRPEDAEVFVADVHRALAVLAVQPGFQAGELGQSPDQPEAWLLMTRWADVGSMRRGLGATAVKIALAPVLVSAADEPSTFEVLLEVCAGVVVASQSARWLGEHR